MGAFLVNELFLRILDFKVHELDLLLEDRVLLPKRALLILEYLLAFFHSRLGLLQIALNHCKFLL